MSNELLEDLTDIFPPVEIALPTRGIFYPEGILRPGVNPEKIKVGTLGIMDEFKYRDPFMIVSGKAIEHLIRHICGDQILMAEEMCEVDIETILLASRLASYGPSLKIKHSCAHAIEPTEESEDPICGHTNTVVIDLHEHILRYGPIENEERFAVLLPRVGQTVYLKPTPYKTTVEVMRNVMAHRKRLDDINQRNQEDFVIDPDQFAKYEEVVNLSVDLQIQTILDCIYGVKTRSGNMVEDPHLIGAWIFELPKSDHDVIAKRITEITDDLRKLSLIRYVCGKCKSENEFNLQMNAEILFLADSGESAAPPISSELPEKNRSSFKTPSRISRRLPSPSVAASPTISSGV